MIVVAPLGKGHATVHDRESGECLGTVTRIERPRQDMDGSVCVEHGWEARHPHEALIVSPWNFGFYRTRQEAAQSLNTADGSE